MIRADIQIDTATLPIHLLLPLDAYLLVCLFLVYVYGCCAGVYAYTLHAYTAHGSQKRAPDPWNGVTEGCE